MESVDSQEDRKALLDEVPAAANIQRDLLASDYLLGKGKVHIGVRPLQNLGRRQQ